MKKQILVNALGLLTAISLLWGCAAKNDEPTSEESQNEVAPSKVNEFILEDSNLNDQDHQGQDHPLEEKVPAAPEAAPSSFESEKKEVQLKSKKARSVQSQESGSAPNESSVILDQSDEEVSDTEENPERGGTVITTNN